MGITRNGPVLNMDTELPLRLLQPDKRFTRAQAHRLLKHNNVIHDPGAPLEQLFYLIGLNNINPVFVPPGSMNKPENKEPEKQPENKPVLTIVKSDDLPNNVPKLRALCKSKKIMFKLNDKKDELLQKLREHGKDTP